MCLVNVVLDDREFLNGPLFDINKRLHLGSSGAIQPFDCLPQFLLKLAIVGIDEGQNVDYFI